MKNNKLLMLTLLIGVIFRTDAAAATYGTDSTSLLIYSTSSKTQWSRSQLVWLPGVAQSASTNITCPASSVTINSQQTVTTANFRYVNGVTTNWNNLPNGRNRSRTSVQQPPQYGQNCEILSANLNWQ